MLFRSAHGVRTDATTATDTPDTGGRTVEYLRRIMRPTARWGGRRAYYRLRLQVGRLNIVPEDLEGRNQRSALFKTMFLAFRASGAQDWRSNLAIALDHKGIHHRLQFHHIFPKAVLKETYTSREADDIANLSFNL